MRIRFLLSLQNLEELLHECGIEISHGSVWFWWNRFGQMFAADIRRQRRSLFDHAHLNRTATGQCRDEQGLHAAGGDGETRLHVGQRGRDSAVVRDHLPACLRAALEADGEAVQHRSQRQFRRQRGGGRKALDRERKLSFWMRYVYAVPS